MYLKWHSVLKFNALKLKTDTILLYANLSKGNLRHSIRLTKSFKLMTRHLHFSMTFRECSRAGYPVENEQLTKISGAPFRECYKIQNKKITRGLYFYVFYIHAPGVYLKLLSYLDFKRVVQLFLWIQTYLHDIWSGKFHETINALFFLTRLQFVLLNYIKPMSTLLFSVNEINLLSGWFD